MAGISETDRSAPDDCGGTWHYRIADHPDLSGEPYCPRVAGPGEVSTDAEDTTGDEAAGEEASGEEAGGEAGEDVDPEGAQGAADPGEEAS